MRDNGCTKICKPAQRLLMLLLLITYRRTLAQALTLHTAAAARSLPAPMPTSLYPALREGAFTFLLGHLSGPGQATGPWQHRLVRIATREQDKQLPTTAAQQLTSVHAA